MDVNILVILPPSQRRLRCAAREGRRRSSFNYEKCKVLHIEHNGNPHNDVFNNIKLETTDKEKDLGILTSTTFKWDEQINACISKANQMIAWVTRNFMLRDKKCYVEYL